MDPAQQPRPPGRPPRRFPQHPQPRLAGRRIRTQQRPDPRWRLHRFRFRRLPPFFHGPDERHPRCGSRHVPVGIDRKGFRYLCAQRLRRHPRYDRYLQFRFGGSQQRFFRPQRWQRGLPQQRFFRPQQRLRFPQRLLRELPDFSFHPQQRWQLFRRLFFP